MSELGKELDKALAETGKILHPQLIVTFKYRVLIGGVWNFLNNGLELDRLVMELLRKGIPEHEIEVEIVEAK